MLAVKTKVETQIAELVAAEESMMDWMKEFRQPKDGDPEEKVVAYLKDEKTKISRVSDQMLESLENGSQLLNQLTENE